MMMSPIGYGVTKIYIILKRMNIYILTGCQYQWLLQHDVQVEDFGVGIFCCDIQSGGIIISHAI
jgi:hypothetical protein